MVQFQRKSWLPFSSLSLSLTSVTYNQLSTDIVVTVRYSSVVRSTSKLAQLMLFVRLVRSRP